MILSKDCLQLICEKIKDIDTLLAFERCSKTTHQLSQLQKKKLGYRFYGEKAETIEVYMYKEDLEIYDIIKIINKNMKNSKYIYTDDINTIDLSDVKTGDIIYQHDGYRGTTTYVFNDNKEFIHIMDGSGYGSIPKEISILLQDPFDFYSDVTSDKLYQGITSIIMPNDRYCMTLNGYPEFVN